MKRLPLSILAILFLSGCTEVTPTDKESGEGNMIAEKITENLVDYAMTALAEKLQSKSCEENPDNCDDIATDEIIVQLVRVSEGDTVILRTTGRIEGIEELEFTVRLLLVDAPELVGDGGKSQKFAEEARTFTQSLLENAKEIRLELAEEEIYDNYGRVLGYLYADNVRVQEELLKVGLAKIAYAFEPNTRYLEEFKLAEEYAKQNGYGLWGG